MVPAELRKKLIQLAHEGHPGIERTKRRLRDLYWWPKMHQEVDTFVRHCSPCQASGKSSKPEQVPVTAVPPPSRPFQKIGIDICGPFFTVPKHQRFVVAIEDYFSKYPEILLTGDVTSRKIISWLEEIFASYGNPDKLLSDNGPQFTCQEFEDFLKARNIQHVKSAVYNLQQNGLIEVFNRSVKYGAQVIAAEGKQFSQGITEFLMAYRSTANEDGISPAELLRGWKMRANHEVVPSTFFLERKRTLEEADETFNVQVNQIRSMADRKNVVEARFNKRRYGLKLDIPTSRFNLGDWVRVKKPQCQVLKGQSPWTSPLRIIQVIGRWTFKLSDNQIHNAR
ncbi:MAG: transposase family protein, partial [Gammaproteobacteria bacterium]|nr:transposase family protein [Gammaproteobacteria bacterium]